MVMCAANAGYASTVAIEKITANVNLANNSFTISPLLAKRMQASVLTIADNVLSGRNVDEVQRDKHSYENLIKEVFDRILLGYTVKSVELVAGNETNINVMVTPWQDVIKDIKLQVVFEQIPEPVATLAQQDVQDMQQIFNQVLQGLPIDAAEWTRVVLKTQLQEYLNVHLPEFRGELDIAAGEITKIQVYLYPKDVVIRDITVSLSSNTIPNIALYNYRNSVQKKAEMLVGVPAAFVKRHEDYFNQWLQAELMHDPLLNALAVETKVDLTAGVRTNIAVEADTKRYLVYLEGYLDIGRESDNTSFKLHAGKYISPVDELFVETDFFPHQVKWIVMPGLSRKITPQLTAGFKYDLSERENILWVKQQLGKRWLLRLEHTPAENFNEFAIRYKLHDFIGIEYTMNDDDRWLRMVGNF